MKKLRKFLQLSWTERWLLTEAVVLLVAVQVGLYFLPFRNLRRLLERVTVWPVELPFVGRAEATRIPWAVRLASSFIPNATCLPQALVTHFLLMRNGYPADLKIGAARNQDGTVAAHAWVTSEQQIVIGALRDLDRYVPLS